MILGIGGATWDEILYLDKQPQWNENQSILNRESYPGGMVATALVAVSRLGIPASMAGLRGSDAAGDRLEASLHKEGVSTELFSQTEGPSSSSVILVDKESGDRSILNTRGVQAQPTWGSSARLKNQAARAKLIHLDGHFYKSLLDLLAHLDDIKSPRPVITLDPSSLLLLLEETPRLISFCDYLMPGISWARRFTGKKQVPDMIHTLLPMVRKGVVITQGEEGCFFATVQHREIQHIPSFPVDVVDSTGAGDAFHGGFLAALYEENPLEEALQRASAVAAINCMSRGAQEGLPVGAQLSSFLNSRLGL